MRILFLCTGNSARSQMAEGWAKHLSPQLDVYSAGTAPAKQVNPFALRVMSERGIDLSGHTPKTFSSIPQPIDLIVSVCRHAAENCPVIPGAKTERWDLPDPAGATGTEEEIMQIFRSSRDDIERRVRELLQRI